jgi:hypothetical protein
MRVPVMLAAVGSALLFQASAHAETPIAERFAHAKAVVLVRVIESTFSSQADTWGDDSRSLNYAAKLQVHRSWKGPFSTGTSIAVTWPKLCGGLCFWYPFQVGEEVVIFINHSAGPMSLTVEDEVIDPAHLKDAISVLARVTAPGT